MKTLRLLFAVLLILVGATRMSAQEAYAYVSADATSVTFYFDTQREARIGSGGSAYVLPTHSWKSSTLTSAVVDPSFASYSPTDLTSWFKDCPGLVSITGLANFNMQNVTSTTGMFENCKGLTSLNLSGLNTQHVTRMDYMFENCQSLTSLDLTPLNTSSVTNMYRMFYGCNKLTELDLSNFNTANVTSMNSMFQGCSSIKVLDLSQFNTANVTDMGNMFAMSGTNQLQTIYVGNGWNTSALNNIEQYVFSSNSVIVGGYGTLWDAARRTALYARIDGGPDAPGYLTRKGSPVPYAAVTMSADDEPTAVTFYYDTQMASREAEGKVISLNLSSETDVHPWAAQTLVSATFDPTFATYTGLTSLRSWFNNCFALTSIVGLENLQTPHVHSMAYMFNCCYELQELDLTGFDMTNVTKVDYMFYGCSKLNTIYATSNWNNGTITNNSTIFYNCQELVGGMGTTFNSYADLSYARLDGGPDSGSRGYFTDKTAPRPYAVLTTDKKRVTFYFDNEKNTHAAEGTIVLSMQKHSVWNVASLEKATFSPSFSNYRPTSMYQWFYNCSGLTTIEGLSNLNTSAVTTMYQTFNGCSSLQSLDLSSFDTRNVTTMNNMFQGCSALTEVNLTGFDMSNVTNASQMFSNCTSLESIYVGANTNWTTANIQDGQNMFSNCGKLVGALGTCYNSNMRGLDYARVDGGHESPGYFSQVGCKRAYAVIERDDAGQPVAVTFYYDTQKDSRKADNNEIFLALNNYSYYGEHKWNGPTLQSATFDASFADFTEVTRLYYWFYNSSSLTWIEGLNHLNTENATTMEGLFNGCSSLTELDLSTFNTANVTNMSSMFSNCSSLTELDLSTFNTANVTNMSSMFYYCSNLETIYVGPWWSNSQAPSSTYTFLNCGKIVGGNGTTYNSSYVTSEYARVDDLPAKPGYLTRKGAAIPYAVLEKDADDKVVKVTFYFDTQSATRTEGTVTRAFIYSRWASSSLQEVVFDDSFADFHGLTSLKSWFSGCTNLETITGLTNLNTENVTTMNEMFNNCSKLTEVDLTNFAVPSLRETYNMFKGCSNLQTIFASTGANWNTDLLTSSSYMFSDCPKLIGGAGTTYYYTKHDKAYARIDGLGGQPGYFTDPTQSRAYAILSADKSSLAFYYDTQMPERKADPANADATFLLSLNGVMNGPEWAKPALTTVTFDPSFKNYTGLTSCFYWFYRCTGLKSIDLSNVNTSNVTDMSYMFYNCDSLATINGLDAFNTSKVTNMSYMFGSCHNLSAINGLETFNTSNVTNMSSMFSSCYVLKNLDLSTFDMHSVVTTNSMLTTCGSLKEVNLTGWDISSLKDVNYMFSNCSQLETIYASAGTDWSTSETLSNGNGTFSSCYKLVGGNGFAYDYNYLTKDYARIDGLGGQPGYFTDPAQPRAYAVLSADKSSVTFYYDTQLPVRKADPANADATFVLKLNNSVDRPAWAKPALTSVTFDASFKTYTGLTALYNWFSNCSNLETIDLTNLCTDNVTNMYGMFQYCSNLKTIVGLNGLNTEKVTSMGNMFAYDYALTSIDMSGMDVHSLTTAYSMFQNCYALVEVDLTGFNPTSLANASYMFSGDSKLTTIFASADADWNLFETLTNSTSMFSNCSALAGGNGTKLSDQTKTYARIDGLNGQPGYFTDKTAKRAYAILTAGKDAVTFYYDDQQPVRRADPENAGATFIFVLNNNSNSGPAWTGSTLTTATFDESFKDYDGLTACRYMFYNCSNLESIVGLTNLNTTNVTTMYGMFSGCSKLQELDISNFDMTNVTDITYMFNNCARLKTIYAAPGTVWDASSITSNQYPFYSCTALVGGKGTTYSSSRTSIAYARIDGLDGQPGFFTEKLDFLLGDVNKDGAITIADVTALVDIVLGKDTSNQYDRQAADVNRDSDITIADVTALVNIILK